MTLTHPLLDATQEDLINSFTALPLKARMRLLDEHPDVYWRALGLYADRLTARLTVIDRNLRRDRRRYFLARVGQALIRRN